MVQVEEHDCDYCDEIGGIKTVRNQASMPINGRVRGIDWCIHRIVSALNAGGIRTMASCCGHKKMHGRIDLADGRILAIFENENQEAWQVSRTPEATVHIQVEFACLVKSIFAGIMIAKIFTITAIRQS